MPSAARQHRFFSGEIWPRALEGLIEAGDQAFLLQGFGQVTKGATPQHACANRIFGKSRDEDDGHAVTLQNQTTLELDTTHPGQVHVDNQAARIAHATRLQEVLGGFERSRGVAEQPQQMSSRFAHRLIVLDDGNIDLRQIEFLSAADPRSDKAAQRLPVRDTSQRARMSPSMCIGFKTIHVYRAHDFGCAIPRTCAILASSATDRAFIFRIRLPR
jgi:hypothetical protein